MQFKDSQRDAIVRGDVTLTFRRWLRPQVRLNGSYRKRHWGGAIVVDGLTALPGAYPELAFSAADVHRTGAADVATLRAEIERHTAKTAGKRTLYRIEFHFEAEPQDGNYDTRAESLPTENEVEKLLVRLQAMDARRTDGPWVGQTLALIATNAGVRAGDLAPQMKMPLPYFKQQVRKLKQLGLTHSLEVGYRLSPTGRLIADRFQKAR